MSPSLCPGPSFIIDVYTRGSRRAQAKTVHGATFLKWSRIRYAKKYTTAQAAEPLANVPFSAIFRAKISAWDRFFFIALYGSGLFRPSPVQFPTEGCDCPLYILRNARKRTLSFLRSALLTFLAGPCDKKSVYS